MAQHHKRCTWKEFYITSFDELARLQSAWQSSSSEGKSVEVVKGAGLVRTNLTVRECRALFRFADVPWRDYVTGIDDVAEAGA